MGTGVSGDDITYPTGTVGTDSTGNGNGAKTPSDTLPS